MRHTLDAGHADGCSRLPLPGTSSAADGERRGRIEEAFRRIVALRHAFDALDASSDDNGLSASEVATLLEPTAGAPGADADHASQRRAADGVGDATNGVGATPLSTTTDVPAGASPRAAHRARSPAHRQD